MFPIFFPLTGLYNPNIQMKWNEIYLHEPSSSIQIEGNIFNIDLTLNIILESTSVCSL